MTSPPRLAVEVWGARGSTPTPDPGKLRYGGNTTCVSVCSAAGDRVVVDAGTGIRNLGRLLPRGAGAPPINLFFTHFHWDHIQGLPYFSPLFHAGSRIRFHAGVSPHEIRARLECQMSDPYFPVDVSAAKAHREFSQIGNTAVSCGSLSVMAFPLNHPQGAWGYRIEGDGAVVVVATDMEHGNPALDEVLREHAANADLLIYDAQYTDAEYSTHQGWGHSTPRHAAAFAASANVKRLLLFHHHPDHDDFKMDQIVRDACAFFPATTAAQERCPITF
jgi:phosphoribosyl 1,2-cyclic phosphodiesterase